MNNRIRISLVAGARPNFMKIAPIWQALNSRKDVLQTEIVHTGQHYDYEMSEIFFEQLELPAPDHYLGVGSGSHGYQTAKVLMSFEDLLMQIPYDLVIVVGDVNSTVAVSLASIKLGVPVAHVEAGLRSFDMTMPEEINRILTDRISSLLFATEQSALDNLNNEGINPKKVFHVGDVMIDSLIHSLPLINNTRKVEEMGLKRGEYVPVTIHRPSNVDSEESLKKVAEILRIASERGRIVFSAHPRTVKNIHKFGLMEKFTSIPGIIITEPMGYLEFMNLMINASFIITDSGGIQCETTWLKIPCITLRENTERPITISHGTNCITGLNIEKVKDALKRVDNFDKTKYSVPKLWDGKAAERIAKIIIHFFG